MGGQASSGMGGGALFDYPGIAGLCKLNRPAGFRALISSQGRIVAPVVVTFARRRDLGRQRPPGRGREGGVPPAVLGDQQRHREPVGGVVGGPRL